MYTSFLNLILINHKKTLPERTADLISNKKDQKKEKKTKKPQLIKIVFKVDKYFILDNDQAT